MNSSLFRVKGVCTHGLLVVHGHPVMRRVLTVVYFGIAEYRVQFIDVHRVYHPGSLNMVVQRQNNNICVAFLLK